MDSFQQLRERVISKNATICVVGMGYVGLPLVRAISQAGFKKIFGLDIDEDKVDKEVKNWKILAQAWFLSGYDEPAIVALREAAKLSDDGELDIRLARSLNNIADYEGCTNSAKTAIQKGDLKRLDESYITLGMCQFEVADFEGAKDAFANAKIDADLRNDQALKDCAASENMSLEELLVTIETQRAFKEMNKETNHRGKS